MNRFWALWTSATVGCAFVAFAIYLTIEPSNELEAQASTGTPWSEVLGEPQGEVPPPRAKLSWKTDIDAAFAQAIKENRPVFATVR